MRRVSGAGPAVRGLICALSIGGNGAGGTEVQTKKRVYCSFHLRIALSAATDPVRRPSCRSPTQTGTSARALDASCPVVTQILAQSRWNPAYCAEFYLHQYTTAYTDARTQAHLQRTFCRHWATKSWKLRVHLSQSDSCGGGSREIMKITRMGCTAQRGGMVSAISIAEMPSAHTSTCRPHVLSCQERTTGYTS